MRRMLEGSHAGLDPGPRLLFVSRRGGGFEGRQPRRNGCCGPGLAGSWSLSGIEGEHRTIEISEAYRAAPAAARSSPRGAGEVGSRHIRTPPDACSAAVRSPARNAAATAKIGDIRAQNCRGQSEHECRARAKLICPPSPGPSATARRAPVPPTAATGGSAPSWRAWARP